MESTQLTAQSRFSMYLAAVADFGEDDNDQAPESADEWSLPRYCLVERSPGERYWYDFADTPEELFIAMASDDSYYEPHALIDLDNGEIRLVRVHYDIADSPVVEMLGG